MRIKKGETNDKQQKALLQAQKKGWRAVLTCVTAIIQSLAIRNLAWRWQTALNGNSIDGFPLCAVSLVWMCLICSGWISLIYALQMEGVVCILHYITGMVFVVFQELKKSSPLSFCLKFPSWSWNKVSDFTFCECVFFSVLWHITTLIITIFRWYEQPSHKIIW